MHSVYCTFGAYCSKASSNESRMEKEKRSAKGHIVHKIAEIKITLLEHKLCKKHPILHWWKLFRDKGNIFCCVIYLILIYTEQTILLCLSYEFAEELVSCILHQMAHKIDSYLIHIYGLYSAHYFKVISLWLGYKFQIFTGKGWEGEMEAFRKCQHCDMKKTDHY